MPNTQNPTSAFFDLNLYVRNVKCVDVAAQMAQGITFRIDLAITSATRQLMKNLRTNYVDHGIDSISEMTASLSEMSFAEEIFSQAGKQELGPVQTINQLNIIRDVWQEICAELTGMTFDYRGQPRIWDVRPMEEVLSREVVMQVRPQTTRRIRMQVERRADGASSEDIDRVYAKRVAMEEARAADMSNTLNSQVGTLITLYQLASTAATGDNADFGFYDLDVGTRRTLIEAAIQGAERAEQYATSNNKITDAEFDAVSFAVIKVERELKAVLSGPMYTVQEAVAAI